MRTALSASVLLVAGGCSFAPPVEGLFNNERDYATALAAHDAAWRAAAPNGMPREQFRALIEARGGWCLNDGSGNVPADLGRPLEGPIDCGVETRPRRFGWSGRVIWRIRLAPMAGDRLAPIGRDLTQLGWDL